MTGYEFAIAFFTINFVGPLFEEIFFRKYILEIFRSKYGVILAVTLTCFIETIFHFGYMEQFHDIFYLIPLFFIFIAFCIVYLNSNLGASVIAHSMTNLMIVSVTWK